MKNLSIANKLWLPVVAMALAAALLALLAGANTRRSQEDSQAQQQEQLNKFELALRWRGMTETDATRAAAGRYSSATMLTAKVTSTSVCKCNCT